MTLEAQLRAGDDRPAVSRRPQVDILESRAANIDATSHCSNKPFQAESLWRYRPPALFWEKLRMLATVRVLRYGLIGTGAALLQLSLLFVFVEFLHFYSLLASTAALGISVVVNYGLQRHFTFRSKSRHVIAGPRFVSLTLVTLAANALLFGAMSAVVPYLLAQIITTATIFPVNYYLNKTFTFRC
ncbi:GtrA family protein [Allomesorhizobium camelthorni]|uniref:GtrA family protein n=1 Tax=Allomesorhizobium camelthorni TaxID=475069 RepID=A0A6G4WP27_9HYPH|nr:GtrA family protein [Mesorhizobium camelthorni]NGO55860.1 GtrA family protein [Mesorhizobium camelthorni]